jgi:hypothetical protein
MVAITSFFLPSALTERGPSLASPRATCLCTITAYLILLASFVGSYLAFDRATVFTREFEVKTKYLNNWSGDGSGEDDLICTPMGRWSWFNEGRPTTGSRSWSTTCTKNYADDQLGHCGRLWSKTEILEQWVDQPDLAAAFLLAPTIQVFGNVLSSNPAKKAVTESSHYQDAATYQDKDFEGATMEEVTSEACREFVKHVDAACKPIDAAVPDPTGSFAEAYGGDFVKVCDVDAPYNILGQSVESTDEG